MFSWNQIKLWNYSIIIIFLYNFPTPGINSNLPPPPTPGIDSNLLFEIHDKNVEIFLEMVTIVTPFGKIILVYLLFFDDELQSVNFSTVLSLFLVTSFFSFFYYKTTFVNSQHENTNSKCDSKVHFKEFWYTKIILTKIWYDEFN